MKMCKKLINFADKFFAIIICQTTTYTVQTFISYTFDLKCMSVAQGRESQKPLQPRPNRILIGRTPSPTNYPVKAKSTNTGSN